MSYASRKVIFPGVNFPKLFPKILQFSFLFGLGIPQYVALPFIGSVKPRIKPSLFLGKPESFQTLVMASVSITNVPVEIALILWNIPIPTTY
jgi:hypothetical protein